MLALCAKMKWVKRTMQMINDAKCRAVLGTLSITADICKFFFLFEKNTMQTKKHNFLCLVLQFFLCAAVELCLTNSHSFRFTFISTDQVFVFIFLNALLCFFWEASPSRRCNINYHKRRSLSVSRDNNVENARFLSHGTFARKSDSSDLAEWMKLLDLRNEKICCKCFFLVSHKRMWSICMRERERERERERGGEERSACELIRPR